MRSRIALLVFSLLAACDGASDRAVLVDVVTDFRPNVDFVAARVEVSDAPFTASGAVLRAPLHEVDPSLDYLDGVRLATLAVGHCDAVYVRVSLLDASGRERAERLAEVPEGCTTQAISVTLSLACANVRCPDDGGDPDLTVCRAGRCARPSCDADAGPACAGCASALDCGTPPRSCQRASCVETECLLEDTCEVDEACEDDGCAPAPRCGDAVCDGVTETPCRCPADCTSEECPASCGDALCDVEETSESCPEDCGPPPAICGDDACEVGEDCPADCGGTSCGDGVCDAGEDCPLDCAVCGDEVCAATERCEDCPECCGVACGDGRCDASEACACALDCGACPVCGDDRCDDGEACPADCDGALAVCGDAACEIENEESCGSCQRDCGWCLGVPEIAPSLACRGAPARDDETVCAGIVEAFARSAENVAYYPMLAARDTDVLSGDAGSGIPPVARLVAGEPFAIQSTRNPGCADRPPLRPTQAGYVFGYVVAGDGVEGRVGWVRAEDLVLDGLSSTRACADGPLGEAFQMRANPYSRDPECRPIECDGPARSCTDANPAGEGADDCDGAVADREVTVNADTLLLRYAPSGSARRYVHRGDRLRVLYQGLTWAFVRVETSASPALTPVGARGWVTTEFLE